ncbi:phosphoglycerate mutase-like protein [Colletotrichum sublineola]|nr:phosphoglycerate mutase-like protein [Colletotrichum sublineola]
MSTQVVTLWCTLHPASGGESELRQVLRDLAAKVREIDWPFNVSAKGPKTLFLGTGPKLIPINDEIDKPLLPDGRRNIYCTLELGRQLRRLYINQLNFIPRKLHISHLHLRSTQYQQTFISLQNLFRGLYPPEFVDVPLDDVLVTLPGDGPVRVDTQPLKLHSVLDTINAVAATPQPQDFLPPEFLNPCLRTIMEKICSEEEFAGYTHSKEFRSLGVGCILQEAVQRMSTAIHQTDQPRAVGDIQRMFLFACHDSTIAGTLASLGAMKDPDWFWPPYTAYITMELFRYVGESVAHSSTNKRKVDSWFIRLNYQGKPIVLPQCAEKGSYLPGCKGVYTFESLRVFVNKFAPNKEGESFRL